MAKKIAEVKTDYTDEQNYTFLDVFFTDDQMEDGKTIGAVCNDTGKVLMFDNSYNNDEKVIKAIADIKSKL